MVLFRALVGPAGGKLGKRCAVAVKPSQGSALRAAMRAGTERTVKAWGQASQSLLATPAASLRSHPAVPSVRNFRRRSPLIHCAANLPGCDRAGRQF